MMGRGRPAAGAKRELPTNKISKQDRKDLQVLADDFRLSNRTDVQEIIQSCKSYSEGQQKIMRVYTTVYL